MTNSRAQLLNMARKGDISAFESLMERYYKSVYCLALKASGDSHDASELAQTVFVRIFGTIRHAGETGVSVLVYKTAAEVCSERLKARKKAGMAIAERATY